MLVDETTFSKYNFLVKYGLDPRGEENLSNKDMKLFIKIYTKITNFKY